MKPFIGIKKIWYGAVINTAVTPASLKTWLASATEVKNSHNDTWGYTEDDPTTTDYVNELTGKVYYKDVPPKVQKPWRLLWVNIHLKTRRNCKAVNL